MSRKTLYEIIEKSSHKDKLSTGYDLFMIVVIFLSLVPLAFKEDYPVFTVVDKVAMYIFILDYIMRWITADYKFKQPFTVSFLKYPFTFMAIVDLVSILPSLNIVSNGFKILRVLRMIRALRVLRVFKTMRYSKTFEIIGNVLKSSKKSLVAVCILAAGYIMVSALVVFNVEPDSFETFFDAVYWATVSLTTVGYGDIYPVSTMGRIITMVSSIFGIAIVALPAGIITAGYMNELERQNAKKNDDKSVEEKTVNGGTHNETN